MEKENSVYEVWGGKKLSGKFKAESAKNAVLPIIAASILIDGETVIKNCPKLSDVFNMLRIVQSFGAVISFCGDDLSINCKNLHFAEIGENLTAKIRSSVFNLAPVFSRFKKVDFAFPGGCKIGERPIDMHVKVLSSLGAKFSEDKDRIIAEKFYLKRDKIRLKTKSVGATENAIMGSVLSEGETYIYNAAREPEIVDLSNFLNRAGAKISGAGGDVIKVEGVKVLNSVEYTPIPDRIETGTFILAALITGGEIEVKVKDTENLASFIDKISNNACNITIKSDIMYIKSGKVIKPFSFRTAPYPFFPTDLQSQTAAMLCLSQGKALIREGVFDDRFNCLSELKKMGADVKILKNVALIKGIRRFNPATVYATDLRGGAALMLAALNADGKSVIKNASLISRGYYNFSEKLRSLGADVKILKG